MKTKVKTIFSRRAIIIATLLGGIFAAGLLLFRNFKSFGNRQGANRVLLMSFLVGSLVCSVFYFVTDQTSINALNFLIVGVNLFAVIYLVDKYQKADIDSFISMGGKKSSGWHVIGAVCLSLLVNIVLVYGLSILIDTSVLDVPGYPKSVNVERNVIVYADNNVEDLAIEQLVGVIRESGFIQNVDGMDLLFSKEHQFYMLKFILEDEFESRDTAIIYSYNWFEDYLNSNLHLHKRIKIAFTDPDLEALFPLQKIDVGQVHLMNLFNGLQTFTVSSNHHIYYSEEVDAEAIEKVRYSMRMLPSYFPSGQVIDVILLYSSNEYTVKLFIPKKDWKNRHILSRLKDTIDYFDLDKKVNIVLIDPETYEEGQYNK